MCRFAFFCECFCYICLHPLSFSHIFGNYAFPFVKPCVFVVLALQQSFVLPGTPNPTFFEIPNLCRFFLPPLRTWLFSILFGVGPGETNKQQRNPAAIVRTLPRTAMPAHDLSEICRVAALALHHLITRHPALTATAPPTHPRTPYPLLHLPFDMRVATRIIIKIRTCNCIKDCNNATVNAKCYSVGS